jgi:hypothetical protein
LQTINIIDNQEEYQLSVFYVFGTKIEFKRYESQKYKPMQEYNKAKLHNISKFAQAHRHGVVSEQFDNVFMNIDEAKAANETLNSTHGFVAR